MKVIKNKIYLVLGLLLIVASCNDNDNYLHDNYGYLKLNFSANDDLISNVTKVDEDPIFGVNILNEQNVIVRSTLNHKDFETDPIKLERGTYYVKATNGDDVECGFDKPFYAGCDTIVIKSQVVETSNVVCTLANVKVSIVLDETVTTNFKECIVAVKNSDSNNGLIYSTIDNTIDKNGFFKNTGTLKWSMFLKNNNNIEFSENINGEINDIQSKEHYVLKVSVSDSDNGAATNIKVTVNTATNDNEYEFIIDLNSKPAPEFTGNGFDISSKQYIPLESPLDWKLTVNAKNGAKELLIKHTSLAMANAGVPYTFDLFKLSSVEKQNINNAGVNWSDVNANNKLIEIDYSGIIKKLPLGDYNFQMVGVDNKYKKSESTFNFSIIPSEEITTIQPEPWAKRVFFNALINTLELPAGYRFEYKLSSAGDDAWISVTDGIVVTNKSYRAEVKGLVPETQYVVRAVSDKDKSNAIHFTTESAKQLPNMSFDSWTKSGKHWYANSTSDSNNQDFIWDSGNKGANTLSEVNPTSPTSNVAVAGDGKQAAHLQSKTVFGILAAGNVYTGQFGKTIGTSGAEIYFGRQYTSRPLALKGYYSYAPVAINKTKAPYNDLSGKPDIFSIYVLLSDWTAWFTVNTSEGRFIDVNDPSVIAYGTIEGNVNTNGYKEFNIPLEYRNNRKPSYCVIVASASKYGDFFTGGDGSILLIDEFEFTF